MTEKIWIVEGRTGEYSDRTDWQVCAFRDEAKAKELAIELKKLASATLVATENIWDWEDSEIGKVWKEKDPQAALDYTGTDYTAYELDLL